ncbi:MAG: cytochrome c biogenesis protein ResB [Sedimentisphaerales bacterium]|nr:cytochrome c biogenesis protein ResB [Sedimentisphaerales bacterium]
MRRLLLWAALALILLLIALSIYGAFIGAEAAQAFFNSIPLAIYWLAFAALLVSAVAIFRRLLHIRGLFLIHIGCVLVLAGGIWGSQAGLKIQDMLFGTDTIRAGQMVIYEGTDEKAVAGEDDSEKELPFAIKLVDFRLEYYQPGQLLIQTREGISFRISAEPGREYLLSVDLGSVEIMRRFENFKLILEGDKRIANDDPNGSANPALELRLKKPDGTETTKYVFERFAGHVGPEDNLAFSYRRTIQEYISDVEVIKDNVTVARKSIEVNKPLHFGGYLFYQQDYDHEGGQYTVLRVTSDSGLGIVYLGYILLCAGVFWHLWLRHIFGDRVIED